MRLLCDLGQVGVERHCNLSTRCVLRCVLGLCGGQNALCNSPFDVLLCPVGHDRVCVQLAVGCNDLDAVVLSVAADERCQLLAGHRLVRLERAVREALDDVVRCCPFDGLGVVAACRHILEAAARADSGLALCSVQDRHDHRTGQFCVRAEQGVRWCRS